MSDDLKIARLCLPVRIRSTPHTRRNGCAWGASPRTGPLFRSTADLCGVEPGGRYLETLTMRGLQYGGRRMPWYPHTHACDACPNPSRGLVQACLWGRVKRWARAQSLRIRTLRSPTRPCFRGFRNYLRLRVPEHLTASGTRAIFPLMNTATNTIRFHVYDMNDRLCGVWYALSEVQAITLAIREGYDAWSTREPTCAGW